jgi:hypothetical protein
MTVQVQPQAPGVSRFAISFLEPKFAGLYVMQRHHYLSHLIPSKYVEEHLLDSEWIELAPGESPEDVVYPDEGLISSIKSDVMSYLSDVGFFKALDDVFCPLDETCPRQVCYGDFRCSKYVLASCGVPESDFFDVFHVLMSEGGFCDCEILYNASAPNRLQAKHWRARGQNPEPYNAHKGI